MHEVSAPHEMAMMGKGAREAKIESEAEGTAEIHWDLDANRLLEVDLRAETTWYLELDYSFEFLGTQVDGEYALDLEGASSVVIRAKR